MPQRVRLCFCCCYLRGTGPGANNFDTRPRPVHAAKSTCFSGRAESNAGSVMHWSKMRMMVARGRAAVEAPGVEDLRHDQHVGQRHLRTEHEAAGTTLGLQPRLQLRQPLLDPVPVPAVLLLFGERQVAHQVAQHPQVVERMDLAGDRQCRRAHVGAQFRLMRQKRRLRPGLFQVLDDRQRLRQAPAFVLQHRHQLGRVECLEVIAQVFVLQQADWHDLVRQPLEMERDPHAERCRRAGGAVEGHRDHGLLVFLFFCHRASRATRRCYPTNRTSHSDSAGNSSSSSSRIASAARKIDTRRYTAAIGALSARVSPCTTYTLSPTGARSARCSPRTARECEPQCLGFGRKAEQIEPEHGGQQHRQRQQQHGQLVHHAAEHDVEGEDRRHHQQRCASACATHCATRAGICVSASAALSMSAPMKIMKIIAVVAAVPSSARCTRPSAVRRAPDPRRV